MWVLFSDKNMALTPGSGVGAALNLARLISLLRIGEVPMLMVQEYQFYMYVVLRLSFYWKIPLCEETQKNVHHIREIYINWSVIWNLIFQLL